MTGGDFEVVSLTPLPGKRWTSGHYSGDRDQIQFVRVSDVVAALEGLAAEYEAESKPRTNPDGSKSYPLVSINEAATDLRELAANLTPDTEED